MACGISTRSKWALAVLILVFVTQPALAADAAPTTMPFAGRVVDANGKAVAGARISIYENRSYSEALPAFASATTDATGAFRLMNPSGLSVLVVRAETFGTVARGISQAFEDDEHAQIVLGPPTTVAITLVGPDSKPLPGVRVAINGIFETVAAVGANLPMDLRDQFTQTTDASGQCTFADMPRRATVSVRVVDPMYINETDNVSTTDAPFASAAPIRTRKGVIIEGKVVRADTGQPVGVVSVNDMVRQERNGYGSGTQTDSTGHFRMTQLRDGEHTLSVSFGFPLSSELVASSLEPFKLAPGEEAKNIEIKVRPGVPIHGTLTTAVTGKPVAGAVISASPGTSGGGALLMLSRSGGSTITDSEGKYVLQVTPGQYRVSLGNLSAFGLLHPSPNWKQVTVAENQDNRVDFVCAANPNPAVKGRVVDEQGAPVAGAVAEATVSGAYMIIGNADSDAAVNDFDRHGGNATTDADGKFEIPFVTDKAILHVSKGELRLTQPITIDATHRDLSLLLAKAPQGSIVIHVNDPTGLPIAGAPATISWGGDSVQLHQKTGVTAQDGTFRATGLYTDFTYNASAGGKGFTTASARDLKVEVGKETAPPPLSISKADSFVAGMVLDANSQPIAGATVMASGRGGAPGNARTDMDGHFRINGLVAGSTVSLMTRADGQQGSRQSTQALAGTDNILLIFDSNAPLVLPARRGIGAR